MIPASRRVSLIVCIALLFFSACSGQQPGTASPPPPPPPPPPERPPIIVSSASIDFKIDATSNTGAWLPEGRTYRHDHKNNGPKTLDVDVKYGDCTDGSSSFTKILKVDVGFTANPGKTNETKNGLLIYLEGGDFKVFTGGLPVQYAPDDPTLRVFYNVETTVDELTLFYKLGQNVMFYTCKPTSAANKMTFTAHQRQ